MRLYTLDGENCNISGDQIRQWRLSAGITQEELAIRMQLNGLQMVKWLSAGLKRASVLSLTLN